MLQIHKDKTQVFPVKPGVGFLGQRIFKTHRRIRRQNLINFYKRTNRRIQNYLSGNLSSDIFEMQINSWVGHVGHADTFFLQKKILKHLRVSKIQILKRATGGLVVFVQDAHIC